jgi:hypothetical protein
MIYTAEELKIKVNKARLMSRDEFIEHEENIPALLSFGCWWLSDVDENDDDYAAYVEGDYTEEDMFCRKDEGMTFLRTALEINASNKNIGKEFIFGGSVFTVLSESLAIANGFQGAVKFRDDNDLEWLNNDINLEEPYEDSIFGVIKNMFGV